MSLDEQHLTALMNDSVEGLRHPNRWNEIPGRAARVTRRRRGRQLAAGGVVAAAALVAIVVTVVPSSPQRHHVQVSHQTTLTTSPPPSAPTSPATSKAPAPPPELPAGYLPLFPFSSGAEVTQWTYSKSAFTGYSDPGRTALYFAGFLGYTEINQVIGVRAASDGDHVSIGFTVSGGSPHIAAIVHLVRFGAGGRAPWEVVGTDDTTFTLTSPPYGSRARAPLSIGGAITGVDESIDVKVFRHGSNTPVRDSCCHAAGGVDSPWSVLIPDPTQYRGILIIAASTGGHVAQVERFAVTGVRSGAS
jgi:hypothetical protein